MAATPPNAPPPSLLLNRVIRYLLPFFLHLTPDAQAARREVIATLAAYGARTRAELLLAAKIIAFNLSVMDTLCEVKTAEDLSPLLRLRLRACAKTLDQAARASEKALERSLRCDAPATETGTEDPNLDATGEETEAFIQHFPAEPTPSTANRLANAPQADTGPHRKGSAMFDALFQEARAPSPPAAA